MTKVETGGTRGDAALSPLSNFATLTNVKEFSYLVCTLI